MIARRAAALVAVLALSSPASAARKAVAAAASSMPDWARTAAATQVAGDLGGVDALVLLDDWLVQPLAEGGVRIVHRRATRVLTPDGLDEASSLHLSYRTDDRVERADAWNLLPDGTLRRPDPDDDVADLPWTRGGNAVDDARLRSVDVPGLVVGSVVATETSVVRAIDTGAFGVTFGDVEHPVGACRLALEVPAGWTASDHAARAGAFTRQASGSGIAWSSPGVTPPPREEWPPPDDERLPRLWVRWRSPDGSRGFQDWDAVARWYRELADPVLKDCGDAAAVSARLRPASPEAAAGALREAFAFASRDVRYVSIQLGIGGFRPQPPAATCSNRYGDCKAKSFLMRSLVEPWGLQAFPVLVLTRDAGSVEPEVPTPGQFNHCIVGVRLPDGVAGDAWNVSTLEGVGRVAFLDPTTESLGPWQLRPDDQGTRALAVLPDAGRLVELPVQPPAASVEELRIRAELDDQGQAIAGEISWRTSGTQAGDFRPYLRSLSAERASTFAQGQLQAFVPGARLVHHETKGLETLDGDVEEILRFEGGRLGQRAGGMVIVQPPSLILPVPAARLPAPPRASRLDLGLPEERRVEIRLALPAGWVPESLPAPASTTTPELTLERSWEHVDGALVLRGVGRQLVRSVDPEGYAAFRDSARRANAIESEGIVLVAAPVTPPG